MILLVSSLLVSAVLIGVAKCYFWLQKRRVEKCEFGGVLLVIAHPDDETMFFAPTLVTLHELEIPVRILCMSTGNADGKGDVRQKELHNACRYLGIPSRNINIINDRYSPCRLTHFRKLPDSMTLEWDPEYISSIIENHIEKNEVLLSFDSHGISGHTNHKACHLAVKSMASEIECYQLQSSSIFLKYLGWSSLMVDRLLYSRSSDIYLLSPLQVINNVYGAMQQHQSQLKWFRLLYILFSRFVIINTVERIK